MLARSLDALVRASGRSDEGVQATNGSDSQRGQVVCPQRPLQPKRIADFPQHLARVAEQRMPLADRRDEFRIVLQRAGVDPRRGRQSLDGLQRAVQVIVHGDDRGDASQVLVAEAVGADRIETGSHGTGGGGASARAEDEQRWAWSRHGSGR